MYINVSHTCDNSRKAVKNNSEDDEWLPDDIKREVLKLEALSQQLDRVIKPEMKAEPEQMELKTQHVGQFEMDLTLFFTRGPRIHRAMCRR